MAHYMVRFSRGENESYVYPDSLQGVVWNSVTYHATQPVMVGETDAALEADGSQITSVSPEEARKLIEDYQAGYPKRKDRTAD